MLTHLSIRDVVLIEKLDLALHQGLTVLTGETGAGKSILLDSLGLTLGERASAGLIRAGASQASVSATFDLPLNHPVFGLLAEQSLGIDPQSDLLTLRRVVLPDGRSRAYVCDQPISITLLRSLASQLVEIQGQHEQMGLADEAGHLDLLDAFGVPSALRQKTAKAYSEWITARKALEHARSALTEATREEEWLRATVEDLESLAPVEGEEDELAALRIQLQHDERRQEAVAAALAELTPKDRRSATPATALRSASRALQRLAPASEAGGEPLDNSHAKQVQSALEALDRAEEALAEAESSLSRLAADTMADPRLLEETEERLFALRAEARKHNIAVSELPSFLKNLRQKLETLDNSTAELSRLEQALREAQSHFEETGAALSASRQKAAELLEKAVHRELKPVKLERARFSVAFTKLDTNRWSRAGMEHVAFRIAANPGQPAGALAKVASGGELSRLMLALKVVLAERSAVGTLVFDEVDSGVGGATASAIGDRLHKVAETGQVFVVTHSPQVAARGDHHLRIAKRITNERTETTAEPLSLAQRREEIARMLAGDVITDAARAAADSLLEPLL
ncbi:DNA repair protein RecN [Neokomagataea thailandica NBRC 106555]|uniref:DNA repair protein RecN n=2 Tax=Neokomagataea TaxID=1223423 RepID=A0A4Y6V729_9PROT|nr:MULTISPECIES: DNA repair protein RecN [Neokomagataea]QDH24135.1 DNA repair protein RecN [Neokomagataea tanensis]GBR50480.1 DNA repair protein RecN [Neokomagataea thailandica NBRC 106555]